MFCKLWCILEIEGIKVMGVTVMLHFGYLEVFPRVSGLGFGFLLFLLVSGF